MIREGDKVTLPTEPGVVQTVGKGVTAETIKDALKILHSNHVSLSEINWIWIPPLTPTMTGAKGRK